MTMLFSTAERRLITMTVDSAVTLDFESHREYETGRKSYRHEGIGVVTTWGAREGNRVGPFLDEKRLSSDKHSVLELAEFVNEYLTTQYRPAEYNLGEVGYHVGGFDRDARPRLFHIFWGQDRPNPTNAPPKYEMYDHSPAADGLQLLYSGRNDLAAIVIQTLLDAVQRGEELRLDLTLQADQIRFADIVARFAGELTPEVGPPFIATSITPKNQLKYVRNDSLQRLPIESIHSLLDSVAAGRTSASSSTSL